MTHTKAGRGLCHKKAVDILVENGPQMIKELIDFGVAFSCNENKTLDLGREGGSLQTTDRSRKGSYRRQHRKSAD